ncbi:uncharacterized protein LOC120329781 isoform X1 [Styela clava]
MATVLPSGAIEIPSDVFERVRRFSFSEIFPASVRIPVPVLPKLSTWQANLLEKYFVSDKALKYENNTHPKCCHLPGLWRFPKLLSTQPGAHIKKNLIEMNKAAGHRLYSSLGKKILRSDLPNMETMICECDQPSEHIGTHHDQVQTADDEVYRVPKVSTFFIIPGIMTVLLKVLPNRLQLSRTR